MSLRPPLFGPRTRAVVALLAATAFAVVVWVVGSRPPPWYPPCVFHAATGFHCPGCGSARAIHAALHGDFLRALHNNALSVVLTPLLAAWLARIAWVALRHDRPAPALRARFALPVLTAVLAFWVLRNLPFPPGPWLAPRAEDAPRRSPSPGENRISGP